MEHGDIVFGLLVPADENTTEPIHPTVGTLHHPTSGFCARVPFGLLPFFAFGWNVRGEVELFGQLLHFVTDIRLVQAQPLGLRRRRFGSFDGNAFESLLDQFSIGPVGAVHGQSHRNALGLDQHTPFDALLGAIGGVFARLFPPRGVPWSCTRPGSARTSRSLSSRRTPSSPLPTSTERLLAPPKVESGHGRWNSDKSGSH